MSRLIDLSQWRAPCTTMCIRIIVKLFRFRRFIFFAWVMVAIYAIIYSAENMEMDKQRVNMNHHRSIIDGSNESKLAKANNNNNVKSDASVNNNDKQPSKQFFMSQEGSNNNTKDDQEEDTNAPTKKILETAISRSENKSTCHHHGSKKPSSQKRCALLFFGLVKDFRDIILPSIQRNILSVNPSCDIFLHTYNVTTVPFNDRAAENKPSKLNVQDSYLLTNNVTMDTMDQFWSLRGNIVNETYKNHFFRYSYVTHSNIIKQWHSIESVWNLMIDHELRITKDGTDDDNNGEYYEQIGLFRLDTFFLNPVNIYEHEAAIPDFAHYNKGYNDRLFYGTRHYAKLWSHRFAFQEHFEKTYITKPGNKGYHAEFFLGELMRFYNFPLTFNPHICVWRVRTGHRLWIEDCTQERKSKTIPDTVATIYLPKGYTVKRNEKEMGITVLINQTEVEYDEDRNLVWQNNLAIDKRRKVLLELNDYVDCK